MHLHKTTFQDNHTTKYSTPRSSNTSLYLPVSSGLDKKLSSPVQRGPLRVQISHHSLNRIKSSSAYRTWALGSLCGLTFSRKCSQTRDDWASFWSAEVEEAGEDHRCCLYCLPVVLKNPIVLVLNSCCLFTPDNAPVTRASPRKCHKSQNQFVRLLLLSLLIFTEELLLISYGGISHAWISAWPNFLLSAAPVCSVYPLNTITAFGTEYWLFLGLWYMHHLGNLELNITEYHIGKRFGKLFI